jgi:putative ABC transport system substrate-binding protein
LRRVAVLWGPSFDENAAIVANIGEAAAARGIELFVREIHGLDDVAAGFAVAADASAQAVVFMTDNALFAHRRNVAELAITHRLPSIHSFPPEAQDGGLMAFSVNLPDRYRRAAALADQILRGARPAELPIEQPTTFHLAVNTRTAAAWVSCFPRRFCCAPTK